MYAEYVATRLCYDRHWKPVRPSESRKCLRLRRPSSRYETSDCEVTSVREDVADTPGPNQLQDQQLKRPDDSAKIDKDLVILAPDLRAQMREAAATPQSETSPLLAV